MRRMRECSGASARANVSRADAERRGAALRCALPRRALKSCSLLRNCGWSTILSFYVLARISQVFARLVRDGLQLFHNLRLLRCEVLRLARIVLHIVQLQLVDLLIRTSREGKLPVALADGHQGEALVVVERLARGRGRFL